MDPTQLTQPPQQAGQQNLPQNPVNETKPERIPIKSLRTYQGDVEEAMAKNKYSATTILVAEQRKREDSPRLTQKPANLETRNKFFTVLGISLLFLGGIVVSAVYYVKTNEEVVIERKTKTIIEFSVEKNISVSSSTKDSLISRIISEKNSWKEVVNSVLYLNLKDSGNNPEKIERVLSLITPNIPSSLLRSFEDKYMFGVISYDTNELFIILTTKDYASAYSGMLRWEKDMATDFEKIFDVTKNTGTSSELFIDEAIRNKDLRVLRGVDKKTKLVYSFVDKNTLVITKNENIFNAILAKYLVSQNVR